MVEIQRKPRPISIAIMALGGQGGGVMAEWTVKAGELAGYRAQYTSVAGVAQRTGATVYYIELFPEAAIKAKGREPVLALMPVPGDVDVVVASELMEAGRAMMRGFVTPDRTTLIASTHRVYAIAEKSSMTDGRSDSDQVSEAGQARAKAFVAFDMERTAQDGGSVISAAMFGALAGSSALPIPRSVFEDVIRAGGVAVASNLKTFALAFERAQGAAISADDSHLAPAPIAPPPAVRSLVDRIESDLPFIAQEMATNGLRRVIDYQDVAFGNLYLDRLTSLAELDKAHGGEARRYDLSVEAARHLALWMSYEDTFRVADLKTRESRFERFRSEMDAAPDQIVDVIEFMHPRLEEVCDSLPVGLGRFILNTDWLSRALRRVFSKGRRVRTSSLPGFLMLWALSKGRHVRRSTLRFTREDAAITAWLSRIADAVALDYTLGLEMVKCQSLVKGYGETHERGMRNFSTLMQVYDACRADIKFAARLKALREAALADDEGKALAAALG